MLPEQDWLPQARRLAVGMTMRFRHRNEGRANMTVGNAPDRWWAYCNRCKEGGVITKEHVLLNVAPVAARELTRPTDIVPAPDSEYSTWLMHKVMAKGMDPAWLPPLYHSLSAGRLLLRDDAGCWHGRDVTEKSGAKWLNYDHAKFVGTPGPTTVITEDLYSMYKIRHAMKFYNAPLRTCCTLGAGLHDAAVLALKSCETIVWAYDGDAAGDYGFRQGVQRMRPFGIKHRRARPPEGKDPKDMHIDNLRVLIEEALCH